MRSVLTVNKKLLVVFLAVFVSLTLFGCEEKENGLSPEQIEKKINEKVDSEEQIIEERLQEFNKQIDDAKSNGDFKKDSFSPKLHAMCVQMDIAVVSQLLHLDSDVHDRVRGNLGVTENQHDGQLYNEEIHVNGRKNRDARKKVARTPLYGAVLRCYAAAEGIDTSFVLNKN